MIQRWLCVGTVFCGLGLIGLQAGCSRSGRPEMVSVSGVVIFEGKPVEGADIAFYNDQSPRVAAGKTDKDGKFKLTTFENNDGAVLGQHQVTVTKLEANPALAGANVDNPSAAYGQGMMAAASGQMDKIAKQKLPTKYADRGTSPLKAEVKKGQKNEFEFKLD